MAITVPSPRTSRFASWLPVARTDERPVDRVTRRKIGIVWGLMFFNVMSYSTDETIVHIPSSVGKVLTQGALFLAFALLLSANRKLVVRPNVFLVIFTLIAVCALMISVRDEVSVIGTDYRAIRLCLFAAMLWLLTPWFGRRDMLLLRCQMRALIVVLGSVVLGMAIAAGKAFSFQGRLGGAIWPIPPTQVAHYAAVTAGLSAVLWFAGMMRRNLAIVLFLGSVAILVLTHTRTALIAMLVGILVAGLTLFTGRQRVRQVFAVIFVVLALTGVVLLPALTHWFSRGQSSQEFTELTGRTVVWGELVNSPRAVDNIIFGYGLSNNSFGGLPIDDSWLAVYQDQGLVGDFLVALFMLSLFLIAAFRPRGPTRAVAFFLLTYCLIASLTETGLGAASTYLLDITVTASLLMPGAQALLEQDAPGRAVDRRRFS